MKPYTYLIGWSRLNLWYYGVQHNQLADPQNLWTTYFTSSGQVKRAREFFGEPDIIEIRKTFTHSDAARNWEHRVLRRLKVVGNLKWLNQTDGKVFPYRAGKDHHRFGQSRYGSNNSFFGKRHSELTKEILRKKAKLRVTEAQRERCKTLATGSVRTTEHKQKYSDYAKTRIWIINKEGDVRHAKSMTDERLLNGTYMLGRVWRD